VINYLPADWRDATFVGRLQTDAGPTPVVVHRGAVRDVSRFAPTTSQLLNQWSGQWSGQWPAQWTDELPPGEELGSLDSIELRSAVTGNTRGLRLLAPFDLQCIKACGVTFAVSAVERVIEERARGESSRANEIRNALQERVGGDLRSVVPGSPAAVRLKAALIADNMWSQYLEVAIGPDAEVFTKAPVLASVGWGDLIGIRGDSAWNNPEPEVVLACNSSGAVLGATLGNDVNLRDIEGRSALLLGKAKDNNASCSIGPFIRMFDGKFTLDKVRAAVVSLEVRGEDGFRLVGRSSMSAISRDPLELVKQTMGDHQYPDGFALFLGTMFAPTDDRDAAGKGFTHKVGDVVQVSSPDFGMLENKVQTCGSIAPWSFGIADLMRNLASRGLLTREAAETRS
jgi:fumarylacetoacetate (FAA) hydrolase family protein